MKSNELLAWLQRHGPQPAGAIAAAAGRSRSATQRELASLRSHLLVVGRARGVRYAAHRTVPGVLSPIPIYEVDPEGVTRLACTLHPVAPFGVYVASHAADVAGGFYGTDPRDPDPDPAWDLPWFLRDLRPMGFLGRAWLRAHADQGFPQDPSRWTGDHVLRYASVHAVDAPGAFLVGAVAREAATGAGWHPPVLDAGTEASVLPRWVELSLEARGWGSSIGGDQPKLLVGIRSGDEITACIVKFSPPVATAAGERWADLLTAEHLVHLRLEGAATSRLVDGGGRRFLIVERFDRHGPLGRSGAVSLAALDRTGTGTDLLRWSLVTAALLRAGRITADVHARVVWLEAFGAAIANTDRHTGNLALRVRGTALTGLAPVYDMLPMFHAPRFGGELPTGLFDPAREVSEWPPGVCAAAAAWWLELAERADVSPGFRRIALAQAALL